MGKSSSNLTIPDKVKKEAKRLYFNHWGAKEISEWLDVNYETVRKWIARYKWVSERNDIVKTEVQELAQRRSHQINTVMRDGFDAIIDSVKQAKAKGVSIEEAEKISKMLSNVDKLYRLQIGKPTEIREERSIKVEHHMGTKENIMKALQDDPFIETDFKDVNETKKTNKSESKED